MNLLRKVLCLVITATLLSTIMLAASSKPSGSLTPSVSKAGLSGLLQNAPLGSKVNIIIETKTSDYSNLINYIKSLGGEIHHTYKYVNAISASIPADSLPSLQASPDIAIIHKDTIVKLASQPTLDLAGIDALISQPTIIEGNIQGIPVDPEQLSGAELNTYWDPTVSNAIPLWTAGYGGKNTIVAIIDTGIWTRHFMFRRTSIIGGIDLSFDNYTIYQQYARIIPWPYNETYEGWDNPYNHWHGSHVAGIIAGRGAILLPENHTLAQAIERYTGTPLPSAEPYGYPGYKIVYLFGIAPYANLYIVKVFDHTGSGIPESLVLNAIEHVIDLKLQGIDIDVISMSLGGPTLYDGRDIEDKLVDYATSVGITVVAAAGNDGPARMTTASPGSANTAITVAAAADPVHTRVFWDYYYNTPGIGYYLYKTNENQIIYFSSRGPTSDGRQKPTVAATGVFVLSAYPTGGVQRLAFASGTSMSTPAVSAAVALLNDYAESAYGQGVASPQDYKQALELGAEKLEGYEDYDQGAGYLNVKASWEALKSDTSLGDRPPELPEIGYLPDISNIPIIGFGKYVTSISGLAPGHKVEYIFRITQLTAKIMLVIENVYLGRENPLGINSFEVYIQSAKRTTYDYYIDSANVYGSAWFKITDDKTTWGGLTYGVYSHSHVIEPGYMKIVIENDWTSYDLASCNITIMAEPGIEYTPRMYYSYTGFIKQGQGTGIAIPLPKGTIIADIRLYWLHDWSTYPTSDIDMYIYWDQGSNFDGATLNSPERAVLIKPTIIYVYIYGYTVYTETEPFLLIVSFTAIRHGSIMPI